MSNKKDIKENELKNVSGGYAPDTSGTRCPKCDTFCQTGIDVVDEGSGCSSERYWLCPNCGHKWKN